MEIEFNNIIDGFVDKYCFPRRQVINEIEKAFSSMLSRWYRMNVVVLYSDNSLKAFGYSKTAGSYVQREFDLQKAKPKGWETIKRIIERNMLMAACREEYYLLKNVRTMGWGRIIKIDPDSKLIVQLELAKKFEIYAECPITRIGRHERRTSAFAIGEKRAFWVRTIHPVTLNGTPRISVMLNRTSKHLPEMLLKEKLKDQELIVKCSHRYPGQKSFITANKFIPKNAILTVESELHEHIQVKYDKKQ
jgi:hypothetical protein